MADRFIAPSSLHWHLSKLILCGALFAQAWPAFSANSGDVAANSAQTSMAQTAMARTTRSAAATPIPPSLSISGSDASIKVGIARKFQALLNNKTTSNIRWVVNGVVGGNTATGTITAEGLYNAPLSLPTQNPVRLIASVVVDGKTVSAEKFFHIYLPNPEIYSVNPRYIKPGAFKLSMSGYRFYRGVKVMVNGSPVQTTYISDSQLAISGRADKIGMLEIFAVNPDGASSTVYAKVGVTPDGKSMPSTTRPVELPLPPSGTSPNTTPPSVPSPIPAPAPAPVADAKLISAARFLEQASFGPSPADLAYVKQNGIQAWMNRQFALPASALNGDVDMDVLRSSWYKNMASGQDQLRQRMIFALSQIWVVSADKNNNVQEIKPWLDTLSRHAFGNYQDLLREMTLNPSMGKYLDMANSNAPAPNENYAREVMQLFTIGTVMLNMDGTPKVDGQGVPLPAYTQANIAQMSRALSGWTYTGPNETTPNWENFTGPLQPRDKYHDKSEKTLLLGTVLPASQTAQQDYDAVMTMLFNHPNLPPFVASRLIRHFVSSNPSPAYVRRVATVFANGTSANHGVRGDLAATLSAVLLDPEARQDKPSTTQGHLKDPILSSLGLLRVMNGQLSDPSNLFWDYFLMGQKLLSSPSVFSFYSPLTHLPEKPQAYGPEFQIYAPSLAVQRANFLYRVLAGEYSAMINVDITPYINVAGDANALINLVNTNLLQGRMSSLARSAIYDAVMASNDKRQRALSALYLTAITSEFAVHQ